MWPVSFSLLWYARPWFNARAASQQNWGPGCHGTPDQRVVNLVTWLGRLPSLLWLMPSLFRFRLPARAGASESEPEPLLERKERKKKTQLGADLCSPGSREARPLQVEADVTCKSKCSPAVGSPELQLVWRRRPGSFWWNHMLSRFHPY